MGKEIRNYGVVLYFLPDLWLPQLLYNLMVYLLATQHAAYIYREMVVNVILTSHIVRLIVLTIILLFIYIFLRGLTIILLHLLYR